MCTLEIDFLVEESLTFTVTGYVAVVEVVFWPAEEVVPVVEVVFPCWLLLDCVLVVMGVYAVVMLILDVPSTV